MPTDLIGSDARGRIVTFYSYKGGVGRSMALANIAILLAQKNLRLLCVDWDLEAPGLDRYFRNYYISPARNDGGLISLLHAAAGGASAASACDYVQPVGCPNTPRFDLLRSGDESHNYGSRVADFSWPRFFAKQGGADFIESLRDRWCCDYDLILIDSRTGVTDSGGVCTIQLPDLLVFVFSSNQQNLDGFERVVATLHKSRASLPYDRARLPILPILSRYDGREESGLAKQWLANAAQCVEQALEDWLPRAMQPLSFLEKTKLSHIPYYSFGESLAVLRDSATDPEQLPFAYRLHAELIADGLRNPASLLGLEPSLGNEAGEIPVQVTRLMKRSSDQLDEIFANSPAGPIPDGECEGTVIVAPGTPISNEIAKVVNLVSWTGKVFDSNKGELRNKVLPVGHKLIVAKVYKDKSWFDGKECIVLDYSKTSLLAKWIRDELREFTPGIYLGIVYWGKKKLIHFALRFKNTA